MTVSLIVSTYNWPDALRLCLSSAMHQSLLPDEIIVADDGSGEETRKVVESFRRISPVPLIHVWHEDRGFRLAEIRNRAFAAAKGDYIIQIDGDMILHENFVYDHKFVAEKGHFVSGTRGMVSMTLTRKILGREFLPLSWYSKGINHRLNAIRQTFFSRLYTRMAKYRYVKGCNMAFWRDDLVRVNGYDENFVGWGGEDNELASRLRNTGLIQKRVKFRCVAFHLYHGSERDESNLAANNVILDRSMAEKRTRCEEGLDRHLK